LNKTSVNYGSVGLNLVIYIFVIYVTLLSVLQTAQSWMESLPNILCRNLPDGTKKPRRNSGELMFRPAF